MCLSTLSGYPSCASLQQMFTCHAQFIHLVLTKPQGIVEHWYTKLESHRQARDVIHHLTQHPGHAITQFMCQYS
jgi:hypothetical protein